MSWYGIAIVVVGIILSVVLAPKPNKPKPAALSDLNFPTAKEGIPIPVIFGTVTITSPNVVWYGHLGYEAVRTKSGK